MSQALTPRQLAVEWLDITIERFIENLRKLRINNTGALLLSFKKQVIGDAQGDQLKLRLSYALYGQFVDMGVGRGMAAGQRKGSDGYERVRSTRGQLRRHARKARPWYSKEIAHQTKRLAELMLDLYGQVLVPNILAALPGETSLTL
ncbi:MAG: hypothetical protein ACRYF0_09395 [Janthinobacterium lividum]